MSGLLPRTTDNTASSNITANTIDANVVTAGVVAAASGTFTNLAASNFSIANLSLGALKLTTAPATTSTIAALTFENTTSNITMNTGLASASAIPSATSAGTAAPVLSPSSTATNFVINSIAANSAQGFTVTDAPPLTGGNIIINNSYLNQPVTTTSTPSFTQVTTSQLNLSAPPVVGTSTDVLAYNSLASGRVERLSNVVFTDNAQLITGAKQFRAGITLGDITNVPFQRGIITLFSTQSTTTTIAAGTLSTIPLQVTQPGGNVTRFPLISNLTDTLVTLNEPQTLTAKTLTSPAISTITNGAATLTVPSTTGTLALVSQIPTNAQYVDLTTAQSITGVKTFTAAPVIGTITNGAGTLTLPSTTGTLALVSQIPTNAQYVDLTTNQTVAGSKTFSGANTTIANLNVTNTIARFANNKNIITYAIASTVGATTVAIFNQTVTINTSVYLEVAATGYCSASTGADLGKFVGHTITYVLNNNGTTTTANVINTATARSGAFGGATMTATVAGAIVTININGIAGDTIDWSGNFTTIAR